MIDFLSLLDYYLSMPVATKSRNPQMVSLPQKEYHQLKQAAEELDTLRAFLYYEEEKKSGKLKSAKSLSNLFHDLDR